MGGFVQVPNDLLELVGQGELDAVDALLLSVIVNLSRKTGYCWATNAALGSMVGLSDQRVRKRISSLVLYGFLSSNVDREAGNSRKLTLTPKAQGLFGGMVADNHPMVADNHPMVADNHTLWSQMTT